MNRPITGLVFDAQDRRERDRHHGAGIKQPIRVATMFGVMKIEHRAVTNPVLKNVFEPEERKKIVVRFYAAEQLPLTRQEEAARLMLPFTPTDLDEDARNIRRVFEVCGIAVEVKQTRISTTDVANAQLSGAPFVVMPSSQLNNVDKSKWAALEAAAGIVHTPTAPNEVPVFVINSFATETGESASGKLEQDTLGRAYLDVPKLDPIDRNLMTSTRSYRRQYLSSVLVLVQRSKWVTAHELGHFFGLTHRNDPVDNLMIESQGANHFRLRKQQRKDLRYEIESATTRGNPNLDPYNHPIVSTDLDTYRQSR